MRRGTDFGAVRHHRLLHEARTRELGLHIAGDPFGVGQIQLQHMAFVRIFEQSLDFGNGLVAGGRRCRFVGILRLHQGNGQLHLFRQRMLMRFDVGGCHLLDFVFPLRFVDFLHGDRNVGQQVFLAESLDAEVYRIVRQFAPVFLVEMVVLGVLVPVQAHAEPFHHRAGLQPQVIRQQFPACSVGHLPIGPKFLFGFVGTDQEQFLFGAGQGHIELAHLFRQQFLFLFDRQRLARQGRILNPLLDVEIIGS